MSILVILHLSGQLHTLVARSGQLHSTVALGDRFLVSSLGRLDHHILALSGSNRSRSDDLLPCVPGNELLDVMINGARFHHSDGHLGRDLMVNQVSLRLSVGNLDGHAYVVILGNLLLSGVGRQLGGVGRSASAGRLAASTAGLSLAAALATVA